MESINIDGSEGEGGGQILRSSLALSLVTGRPVKIRNIRAGRKKPGLQQQHLTAVKAAAAISEAKVMGAEIGARSLSFEPGPVRAGEYRFSVGTAGSATLVLQTVLPALLTADGPTTLILEGGTHNPWAPPFDFLQRSFIPLINRMGPHVSLELERCGFFPAGGGRFRVDIQPAAAMSGFDLCDRGEIVERRGRVLLSNLPLHVARREVDTILKRTGWDPGHCAIEEVDAAGPGNVVILELASSNVTEVFINFGRHGVKAEQVADHAVQEARDYLAAGVPVGSYLADQLMLPLGISAWRGADHANGPEPNVQRGGAYRTHPLSRHATTHVDLLRQFLGIAIDVDSSATDGSCTVRIGPPSGDI
jgi:RNA 3'-terminal phosphate cyclase (ATP)